MKNSHSTKLATRVSALALAFLGLSWGAGAHAAMAGGTQDSFTRAGALHKRLTQEQREAFKARMDAEQKPAAPAPVPEDIMTWKVTIRSPSGETTTRSGQSVISPASSMTTTAARTAAPAAASVTATPHSTTSATPSTTEPSSTTAAATSVTSTAPSATSASPSTTEPSSTTAAATSATSTAPSTTSASPSTTEPSSTVAAATSVTSTAPATTPASPSTTEPSPTAAAPIDSASVDETSIDTSASKLPGSAPVDTTELIEIPKDTQEPQRDAPDVRSPAPAALPNVTFPSPVNIEVSTTVGTAASPAPQMQSNTTTGDSTSATGGYTDGEPDKNDATPHLLVPEYSPAPGYPEHKIESSDFGQREDEPEQAEIERPTNLSDNGYAEQPNNTSVAMGAEQSSIPEEETSSPSRESAKDSQPDNQQTLPDSPYADMDDDDEISIAIEGEEEEDEDNRHTYDVMDEMTTTPALSIQEQETVEDDAGEETGANTASGFQGQQEEETQDLSYTMHDGNFMNLVKHRYGYGLHNTLKGRRGADYLGHLAQASQHAYAQLPWGGNLDEQQEHGRSAPSLFVKTKTSDEHQPELRPRPIAQRGLRIQDGQPAQPVVDLLLHVVEQPGSHQEHICGQSQTFNGIFRLVVPVNQNASEAGPRATIAPYSDTQEGWNALHTCLNTGNSPLTVVDSDADIGSPATQPASGKIIKSSDLNTVWLSEAVLLLIAQGEAPRPDTGQALRLPIFAKSP